MTRTFDAPARHDERPDDAVVETPRIRSVVRRGLFWVGAAIVCLLVVVGAAMLTTAGTASEAALDGESPSPQGAKAVLQVLRGEGVDVVVAHDYDEAISSLGDDATLALYDPFDYLSADRVETLSAAAAQTVLISPTFTQLQGLAPGIHAAGISTEESLDASCALGAADRAKTISGGGPTFAIDETDAEGCFESETSGFAVARAGDMTLVGPTSPFANGTITQYGNAAFALGVLGERTQLVWYLPSIEDIETTGPPSIQELVPTWLVPTTSLLAITALVAMFWRARRFGPLVAEDLPVTVRSGETMEGRARLYQRIASRVRAADALRIGTAGRLTRTLGLSVHTSVYEIADAAASATGRSAPAVRGILVDLIPRSERDLVSLSDALRDLERAVAAAVDPGRPPTR